MPAQLMPLPCCCCLSAIKVVASTLLLGSGLQLILLPELGLALLTQLILPSQNFFNKKPADSFSM